MKTLLLALCMTLPAILPAGDLLLTDGTVLKRAKIVGLEGETAVIVHEGGASTVPASVVPVLDLTLAKQEIDRRAADPHRATVAAHAQAITERRDAKVLEGQIKQAEERERLRIFAASVSTSAKLFQIVPGGALVRTTGIPESGPERVVTISHEEMRQGTGLDSHKKVPFRWVETKRERTSILLPDYIFVKGDFKGLKEDAPLALTLWPAGSYSYDSLLGFDKKVPAFTQSVAEFLASEKK